MTERDAEVLRLYDLGLSTREIALDLDISQSTASRVIRRHRAGEARDQRRFVRSDYDRVAPMPDLADFVRHTLYRFYDADDELIYVGITGLLPVRLEQHAATKSWFEDVATVRLRHYATRSEVESAEREAILRERPRHNRIHGDSSPWRPRPGDS